MSDPDHIGSLVDIIDQHTQAGELELATWQLRDLDSVVADLSDRIKDAVADDWSDYEEAARFALAWSNLMTRDMVHRVLNDAEFCRLVEAAAGRPYAMVGAIAVASGDQWDELAMGEHPARVIAEHIETSSMHRGEPPGVRVD